MTVNNYDTGRRLLNLEKLCAHYNQSTINIAYDFDDTAQKVAFITTPLHVNIFMRMKCYIAYIPSEDRLIISPNLIGVDNFWLQQLQDDHKNKRIDLGVYQYA